MKQASHWHEPGRRMQEVWRVGLEQLRVPEHRSFSIALVAVLLVHGAGLLWVQAEKPVPPVGAMPGPRVFAEIGSQGESIQEALVFDDPMAIARPRVTALSRPQMDPLPDIRLPAADGLQAAAPPPLSYEMDGGLTDYAQSKMREMPLVPQPVLPSEPLREIGSILSLEEPLASRLLGELPRLMAIKSEKILQPTRMLVTLQNGSIDSVGVEGSSGDASVDQRAVAILRSLKFAGDGGGQTLGRAILFWQQIPADPHGGRKP